jgi:beta-lactamase regulating signal transducer with metallopeptidase domain
MNSLYHSAFAEALGWSLIDSLWQMGAAWLFYIVLTGNSCRFSSQQRHSLALLACASGTLIFFLSLAFNYYSAANNTNFYSLAYFIENQAGESLMNYPLGAQIVPFISLLYLPAVTFFSLRLLLQVGVNKNIYRRSLMESGVNLAEFVNEMSERSGIVKKVTVWISDKVESPLTIGFWKPAILLPVAVFSHLSCKQVEAVLMHELHHIKRNDYLINILLTLTEVIFFFNPFARIMFATVKKERENSCDDQVIASGFDAWEYSQALYILGRYRNEKNNLAIAATGEGKEYLLQRIRRIINRTNPSPSVLKPFLSFFLCLLVAGFAGRQKQMPLLPVKVSAENKAVPVVYFSETKQTTIIKPKELRESGHVKKSRSRDSKQLKSLSIRFKKIEIISTDEPEMVEDFADGDILTGYVALPNALEFTIIDHAKPVIPVMVCESPQPYIQKSSFYFTEVDTTAGKKVIVL